MISYDYYRIFYYVAQYKSFTKAAEMLDNNQPNITRCMNNLESEIGCKLFVRSNRGITLTPEGERLYEHVAAGCEQFSAGECELAKDKGLERGLINIGASETALRLILLDRLETFHETYPHVRLKISNHSSPQAISALENGLADISVITTPVTIPKNYHKESLYSFRELLIGGTKYADLASKMRSLHDLKNIPQKCLGNDTATRNLYIEFFLNHHLQFAPDMEAATTDQVLPMVEHNLGIGFYPEDLCAASITSGSICPIRLVEPLPEREVCLVWDKGRPLSIAAKKLIDTLKHSILF